MKTAITMYEELAQDIQRAYQEPVTMGEAERLAAKFLGAQMTLAGLIQAADLDARMRRTGVKAIKASVYLDGAKAGDKKPSDVMLNAMVDSSDVVKAEQEGYDEAEVYVDLLQNYYNTFKEAHIFFRGISKGNFGG